MEPDPHLPPPAVCEWLLAQDWGQPISTIDTSFPEGHPEGLSRSIRCDYHEASVAIGADETAHIQLPDTALALLRERFPAHSPV